MLVYTYRQYHQFVSCTFDIFDVKCKQYHRTVWHPFLPPATKLGQGYIFAGICDSVTGGGSASVHAGIPPAPQGADIPREQTPPWEQTPLLPAQSMMCGTRPTGMQSC